jgi:tripeptidyl-peptidase-1
VRLEPDREPATNDQFLQWINYMTKMQSVLQMISLGYGFAEPTIPKEYATTLCILFAQLGVSGVSILVASKNAGIGLGNCKDTQGNVQFYTFFPASCMCNVYYLLLTRLL